MRLKENIKRILKEETSLQTKLEELIETQGIWAASKAVGGISKLGKILNLDFDDVDVQERLVRNFINSAKIEDLNVVKIEKRISKSGNLILRVYFETESNASNIDSWYDRIITDEMNKLFPFNVNPSWEPAFAGSAKGVKIFIDSEKIKYDNLDNVVTESHINPSLRRRFSQDLDDIEIRKIIRVVMGDKYLEDYTRYDSFVDDVVMDVSDYIFDENNITISDGNNYFLHRELYDYLMDEYSGMIIKYYRSHKEEEDEDDELYENTELKERCWKGYTQKGMKTMFGKRYPNCVKIKK
jgi:hypothetical protein